MVSWGHFHIERKRLQEIIIKQWLFQAGDAFWSIGLLNTLVY